LIVDVLPVTGAEVRGWWCEILRREPRPSPQACDLQAKHLAAHIWHGAADHQRARANARAIEAARLLLATLSDRLRPLEATAGGKRSDYEYSVDAYAIFEAGRLAILEVLAELDPVNFRLTPEQGAWFTGDDDRKERLDRLVERIKYRTGAPAWVSCAIICWLLACDELDAIGRKDGVSADSAAVKFAVRAVQRLGFQGSAYGITANALAKHLRRIKWAPRKEPAG
jgi:hypothetical protein